MRGGGHVWCGACMVGGMHRGGRAWQGGVYGRRGHVWRGACVPRTPPPPVDTKATAYGQ